MLSLGGAGGVRRVYLAVGATDLRKGFDGLYGLVRSRLEEDPLSGQLFVFCNAGRTRVKALYCDGSGLILCAKRLARGRFDWPEEEIEGVAKVAISATEFAALMDGLELTRTRAKLWWRKKVEQAAGNYC
jgi:transposase